MVTITAIKLSELSFSFSKGDREGLLGNQLL
jgi:hypothetical protein